jgi:hypothetical protein
MVEKTLEYRNVFLTTTINVLLYAKTGQTEKAL